MKILIVDDDPGMADLLRRNMLEICHDVVIAYGLEEALKILSEIPPPDIILLDLALVDSSTEMTISRIPDIRKSNEESVLIVLTGTADPSVRERILAAGADGFFTKDEMMPMMNRGTGFLDNFAAAIDSLIKRPVRYQKNIKLFELLAARLSKRGLARTKLLSE